MFEHPKASKEKRQAFANKINEHKRANRPIIYIDESGFSHDMPRAYGRSKKGKRCFGLRDWGAKGRTNAIGALLGSSLFALTLFECTINTEAFSAWITQELLPKLPCNSVIVMDNAAFHKNQKMQDEIRLSGHTLEYLPPYSPDLNPIEHKWAQVKSIRKKYRCDVDTLFKEYCT